MAKVTFKKDPAETGLAAVGYHNRSVDIKFKKKVFGRISAPNWRTRDNKWVVGIMVHDQNTHVGWHWVFFKMRHDTEQEARDWITANFEKISQQYSIRFSED